MGQFGKLTRIFMVLYFATSMGIGCSEDDDVRTDTGGMMTDSVAQSGGPSAGTIALVDDGEGGEFGGGVLEDRGGNQPLEMPSLGGGFTPSNNGTGGSSTTSPVGGETVQISAGNNGETVSAGADAGGAFTPAETGGMSGVGGMSESDPLGCSFITDFDSPLSNDEWLVLGEAERNDGGWLEMTNYQRQVAGGIALVGLQVTPGDLDVSFKVSTGRCAAPGNCDQAGQVSDGFAVTFWNVPRFEIESLWDDLIGRACIGYCVSEAGLSAQDLTESDRPEGFTVEFDTYGNSCPANGSADPTMEPHVAIHLDGRYYTFDPEQQNYCSHPDAFDGLWDPVPQLVDNQWHSARVVVRGNYIRVYFDGRLVVDSTIPAFNFKGGVLVFSGGSGAVPAFQRFDDLELRGQRCTDRTVPATRDAFDETAGGNVESGGATPGGTDSASVAVEDNEQGSDHEATEALVGGNQPSNGDGDDANGGTSQSTPTNESVTAGADSQAVLIQTNLGSFTIALDVEAAPNTVANFLRYIDSGFYDGSDGSGATTFHRVISNFMIQGGGILVGGARKMTDGPIRHESPNGLLNRRGTVSMARTNQIHSATSQFFVNHIDNAFLDYESEDQPGYVVFGEVIDGMSVVNTIANVQTNDDDRPLEDIIIQTATRL